MGLTQDVPYKPEEFFVKTRKCEPDSGAKVVKICERQVFCFCLYIEPRADIHLHSLAFYCGFRFHCSCFFINLRMQTAF